MQKIYKTKYTWWMVAIMIGLVLLYPAFKLFEGFSWIMTVVSIVVAAFFLDFLLRVSYTIDGDKLKLRAGLYIKALRCLYHICAVLAGLILSHVMVSCNGDVFIKEFMPSSDNVHLTEKHPIDTVRFSSGDWKVLSCPLFSGIVRGYNLDGTPQLGGSLTGLGRLVIQETEYIDVIVTRQKYDEIIIESLYNRKGVDAQLTLFACNGEYSHDIKVNISPMNTEVAPSINYQVQNISYGDLSLIEEKALIKTSTNTCTNNNDYDRVFQLYAGYDYFVVEFRLEDAGVNVQDIEQTKVLFPYLRDGEQTQQTYRADFPSQYQTIRYLFDDMSIAKVTVPANSTMVVNCATTLSAYEAPFRAELLDQDGNGLVEKGTIRVMQPTNYEYEYEIR